MKICRFLLLFACVGTMLTLAIGCSHSDEPEAVPAEDMITAEKENGNTVLKQLMAGELDGVMNKSDLKEFVREVGKSWWRQSYPVDDWESLLVGYQYGYYLPSSIVFKNSECMVDFITHVPNYPPQYFLLENYWEEYCKKVQTEYRLYISVPYEHNAQENTLTLGRRDYVIEDGDSTSFQLGHYLTDGYKDYKSTCIFAPDTSQAIDSDLMLVYDSYEQMRDDVIRRLKEAFGEEGKLDTAVLGSKTIKFEELEKEMAEMAYECPYWFAPKPAWY